jgi:two-component system cell cycle response regulator
MLGPSGVEDAALFAIRPVGLTEGLAPASSLSSWFPGLHGAIGISRGPTSTEHGCAPAALFRVKLMREVRRGAFVVRVLIAEDDSASLDLLATVLKKDGHEVIKTANGAEAWAALQQPDAPRLAILDWMMPEMDGLEVVRRVRALETDQPPHIIMLTAKDQKTDIIAALNAGANDYLAKPFNLGELRARIAVGQRLAEMQAALIESRRELAHLATHDPLTGMLNRRAILDRLSEEISRASRHGGTVAVGMCDIDHFKRINDMHGHQTGDDVLRRLSQVLSTSLREYDHVGRFGGEEFLAIAPIEAGSDPVPLFERLRRRVAEATITTRSGILSVTLSVGLVSCTGDKTIDELLTTADAALYEAKNQGRNRVVYDTQRIAGGD